MSGKSLYDMTPGVNEKLNLVRPEVRSELEELLKNITVEEKGLDYALLFNGKSLILHGNMTSEAVELWLIKAGIPIEKAEKLTFYLKALIDSMLKGEKEELKWSGEDVEVEIRATDGVSVPLHGFIVTYNGEMLVSEVSYVYVVKRVRGKDGYKEYETIEPIHVYARFKDGAIVERGWKPILHDNIFKIADRPIKVETHVRASKSIFTLMTEKTLRRFLRGETSKPLREIFRGG